MNLPRSWTARSFGDLYTALHFFSSPGSVPLSKARWSSLIDVTTLHNAPSECELQTWRGLTGNGQPWCADIPRSHSNYVFVQPGTVPLTSEIAFRVSPELNPTHWVLSGARESIPLAPISISGPGLAPFSSAMSVSSRVWESHRDGITGRDFQTADGGAQGASAPWVGKTRKSFIASSPNTEGTCWQTSRQS